MDNRNGEVTYDNALARLAEGLLTDKKYNVGTFREFLVNNWSQSYDNPEYFKAWHVQIIAEDIEECVAEGLNYVCVLPRFHFKSTVLGHAFSVWRLLTAPRARS